MITAREVRLRFRKGLTGWINALDGFSVTVRRGDIYGLLGPNGAGKSTAMYTFLGLLTPESGSVEVLGEKLFPGSHLFQRVAYLPEEPHYHLYLTVEEAVSYYASLYPRAASKKQQAVLMETFGLSNFRRLKLARCSKGMKQKVGLIQALVNEAAEIFFLDEPTRGLDPLTTARFREILLEKNRQGVTVILNSHVLAEVEMICNRVAIMDRGKVVVEDELKHLLHPENNYDVEFEPAAEVPEWISVTERTGSSVKAVISQENLPNFFDFLRQSRLRLYLCALKKTTLEETFKHLFQGGSGGKTVAD
ncbi:MAG TPA: ABC transporter ATP-binding protein [bacterium]|nr:ABC transporter ATP-binding protein [bacterium]HOL67867.1 ABC transporter ATP-binding protein [bacterium]HPP12319.1 ABC transporter ATP-binding protein [bacterium]